jgi:hypothetical protein
VTSPFSSVLKDGFIAGKSAPEDLDKNVRIESHVGIFHVAANIVTKEAIAQFVFCLDVILCFLLLGSTTLPDYQESPNRNPQDNPHVQSPFRRLLSDPGC